RDAAENLVVVEQVREAREVDAQGQRDEKDGQRGRDGRVCGGARRGGRALRCQSLADVLARRYQTKESIDARAAQDDERERQEPRGDCVSRWQRESVKAES